MATDPLALWGDGGVFAAMVVGVNLFNLFAGYTAMAVLATRTLELRGNGGRRLGAGPAAALLAADVAGELPRALPARPQAAQMGEDAASRPRRRGSRSG